MLSPEHRAIVKATVPLLEAGGEALTTHFYRMLLTDHPELRPYFNQASQQSGEQQRALANGVLMYARHIDRLQHLGDLVTTIVNRHVSLQVRAEHYPVVGACLLRAMREVLGEDIATDAVIEAWHAAYFQLADILVGAEKTAYDSVADSPGGWRGARSFTVMAKIRESNEITSFWFEPTDGDAVVAHEPGQHVGLRAFVDGVEVRRSYSLSSVADGKRYRISVKRRPNGVVSKYLHDCMHPGDTVELFPPAGDFVLDDSGKPLVLISGGVGITSTLPMLQAALAADRPIHFIHAARHSDAHAFRDWIDDLAEHHPRLKRYYCYEVHDGETPMPDATGFLDAALLATWMPSTQDVDVYVLGPRPFMRAIRSHLRELGVPDAQVRYGFFGSPSSLD
ncbi:nitric oxide dioxygenase [Luteibacter rhizovicinus]|uniref:nitric oxide dioxygenase n=1 Tax=Luteibacter rhizovicinus TaxID=242606 RepID=A0A4R3YTL1_9GAMM|nr:NO-inducible flavohemoprotein [Luteibacter rhizovicinus]TCV96375.1 nitric oxide dioxygenase [Luteibacter rhizovicinus]